MYGRLARGVSMIDLPQTTSPCSLAAPAAARRAAIRWTAGSGHRTSSRCRQDGARRPRVVNELTVWGLWDSCSPTAHGQAGVTACVLEVVISSPDGDLEATIAVQAAVIAELRAVN